MTSRIARTGDSLTIQEIRKRIGGPTPMDENTRQHDLDLPTVAEKIAENVIGKFDQDFEYNVGDRRSTLIGMVKSEVENELHLAYPDLWSRADSQIDEKVAL